MKNLTLNIPPVCLIDEEIVESSEKLGPDDVGNWAVVLSNGEYLVCKTKKEVDTIIEHICKQD